MRKQDVEVNLRYEGSLYTFQLKSGANIRDLKDQIFNKLHISPESQDLEFNDTNITVDQRNLADISAKMPILIKMEIMEERAFKFNNLKEKQNIFTSQTTNFRDPKLLYPGLILMAKCKTPNCDAFKKEVYIKKGFGKVELGRLLMFSRCPLCQEKTERVYNFGYFKTNIAIEGASEKGGQYKLQECADDDQVHSFKQSNGVQQWDYLEITTTALQNKW